MATANMNELLRTIRNLTDRGEISQVVEAVKFVQAQTRLDARRTFRVGDKVKFTSKGQLKVGVVSKIMTKNIGVNVPGPFGNQPWRVSPTLLALV